MQLALKSGQASDEVTPLDADIDRSNFDSSHQSANVSVASGSGAGFMSEAALIRSIHLEDKTQTISSVKTSGTLSGLIRPVNKDVLSNNIHQQVKKKYATSESFLFILYLYRCILYEAQASQDLRHTLGALKGNLASGGQSNEQVQANYS